MVTVNRLVDTYNGLSTDTKPTIRVRNGSRFVEMDTGKLYMFDQENSEWLEQTTADENEG